MSRGGGGEYSDHNILLRSNSSSSDADLEEGQIHVKNNSSSSNGIKEVRT